MEHDMITAFIMLSLLGKFMNERNNSWHQLNWGSNVCFELQSIINSIFVWILGAIDSKRYESNHAKIGQYDGIADQNCGQSCNQVVAKCINCSKGRSLKKRQKSAKLTNADTASVGEFPWMASLQSNKTKRHFCSGTVINSNWIITAAHCFK